jgi:hypothetical protein
MNVHAASVTHNAGPALCGSGWHCQVPPPLRSSHDSGKVNFHGARESPEVGWTHIPRKDIDGCARTHNAGPVRAGTGAANVSHDRVVERRSDHRGGDLIRI